MSLESRTIERRRFIRHPTDMPIAIRLIDVVADQRDYLRDVSSGGLSFNAAVEVPVGSVIEFRIPVCDPAFEARGVVVWTRRANRHYEVGVRFEDRDTAISVRMVEQVCHIEQYKLQVRETEGRELTGEQAAMEWIEKHAHEFPR